jgi:hypothetical protein
MRRFYDRIVFAVIASFVLHNAFAQGPYPNRAITLVAPYAAGGDADLAARAFANFAGPTLGQGVIVVNRTGASGVIGSDSVKRAAPDGYTLLLARTGSQAILPAISPAMTKYKWDDLMTVGILEVNPYGCAVREDAPFKNFNEFAAALKAKGPSLNYGTAGTATTNDMGPRLLFTLLNLGDKVPQQVPFKGTNEAATALLAGQIDFSCGSIGTMLSLIKAGKLRALLITTPTRYKELPDVPTASELGIANMEQIIGWSGISVPLGTPKPVIDKLTEAILALDKNPNWRATTEKMGSVPNIRVGPEATQFVKQQYETYFNLGKKLDLIDKIN